VGSIGIGGRNRGSSMIARKMDKKKISIIGINRGLILLVVFSVILALNACTSPKNTVEEETEPEVVKTKYNTYFEIHSLSNDNDNNYDLEIDIDGEEIGTVAGGKTFTKKIALTEGEHELVFKKLGHSLRTSVVITVSKDMTYSCDVKRKGASIKIQNSSIKDGTAESEDLKVDDVTGLVLDSALEELENDGFKNIEAVVDGTVTENTAKWIVTEQNVDPGKAISKWDPLVLNCIPIEEYLIQTYKGKSLFEIKELENKSGFLFSYLRYSDSRGINKKVKNDLESNVDVWKVVDVKYIGDRQVSLLLSSGENKKTSYNEILKIEEIHSPEDGVVEVGGIIDVTITAYPMGLKKEDFQFEIAESVASYSVTEIKSDNDNNKTEVKIRITGKSVGKGYFSVKSNYDIKELMDDEKGTQISITVKEKTKEEVKQDQDNSKVEIIPNNPQPRDETPQQPSGGGVFVTPTGIRYHHSASCAGKNWTETTLEDALSRGLTPCQKCVK
jgi:hypothetical protein